MQTCRKPLHIYNASVCCKETHSQESHGDAEWLFGAYIACPACSLCALSAAQEQTTMQDKCNTQCFLDVMHSSRMHLRGNGNSSQGNSFILYNLGCLFAVFYSY